MGSQGPPDLVAPSSISADSFQGSRQAIWRWHLSKHSVHQGTVRSLRKFREKRGNVPSLETLGCLRDNVPKTQLQRIYLEILIGVEKLEKVAKGQEPSS